MEYELELEKIFDKKEEGDNTKVPPKKSISFTLGLFSHFDKNGKVINKTDYEPVLEALEENILEMDLKTRLKALWDISKRFLRGKMRYLKCTEDNITYTYRGPAMSEM